jgi:tRNA (cytosine38-C5)-methyltransferase
VARYCCINEKESMTVVRYVEFFAGIGGWTMALQQAILSPVFAKETSSQLHLECCAALDHSDLCLSVYQHNHRVAPSKTGPKGYPRKRARSSGHLKSTRIEHLTVQQVSDWQADLWLMSPPCQPHTRQHSNQEKDLSDARSDSFLHLCHLLEQLPAASRPALILLENVVGFEISNSCRRWDSTLARSNYSVARFHLQPTQVGLPNDRPRFYSVAVNRDRLLPERSEWLSSYFVPTLATNLGTLDPVHVHSALPELGMQPANSVDGEALRTLGEFLDQYDELPVALLVPDSVLQRPAAWCFDIVTPASKRTSCFTSAYGKYIKGTGSVLLFRPNHGGVGDMPVPNTFAMVAPEERQFDSEWVSALKSSRHSLRYFSGSELARLFGFSESFTFPAETTTKQQWKLVGNSLNVAVSAKLVELGLRAIYETTVDQNPSESKV